MEFAAVEEAGLLAFGSRARYQVMFRVDERRLDTLMTGLRSDFRNTFVSARSYRSTGDEIGQDLQRSENYLSLVGLVVVVLGGIGVSSVTRVFIDQKLKGIAVLKCVGAGTSQVVSVYLLQVMVLGLGGSLMGLALGRLALAAAPSELGNALEPRFRSRTRLSPGAMLQAVGIGLMVSLLFSLVPLLRVRHIKPSLLLRQQDGGPRRRDWLRVGVDTAGRRGARGARGLAGRVVAGRRGRVRRVRRCWRSCCTPLAGRSSARRRRWRARERSRCATPCCASIGPATRLASC